MDLLVKKNVALMHSAHEGGMMRLLNEESVGGNAGTWKKLPCAAANFHFSPQTGEIFYFGNQQNVPKEFSSYPGATFKVAMVMKPPVGDLIVEFVNRNVLSPEARRVLEYSVKEFNSLYGYAVRKNM